MAISHNLISKAKLSERPIAPLVLVGAGISFALATGLLLMGIGLTAAVLVPLAVGVVLLALWSPYWGLVVTLAQFAFLPSEGELFGHFVPNVLQLLAPIVLGAGLLQALKNAYHERLAPRLADFLVAGFGVWGLVGTFISPYGGNWKWYGNRMLFPMMLYFAVRLLRLDRKQVRTLILVLLAAIALQSILMFRESMAGSSPLYEVGSGLIQGVKPAKGPFPFMWNAATYLALWPSLFVYAIATTRGKQRKGLWGAGLLAVLVASTRTMERGGLAASLIAIAFCLLSGKLRRTALIVMLALAVAYVPWSMGQAGSSLLERFRQTDQSRYAYRTAAINLLKSDKWNPIFGVGWARFGAISGEFGTEEQIIAYGTRLATVRQTARGSKLHNVWLAIPVEFGGVGVLLAMGLFVGLIRGIVAIRRFALAGSRVDEGLVVSLLGSLIALAGVGYYQNIYMMAESMSVLWVFYALLTSHADVFLLDNTEKLSSDSVAEPV